MKITEYQKTSIGNWKQKTVPIENYYECLIEKPVYLTRKYTPIQLDIERLIELIETHIENDKKISKLRKEIESKIEKNEDIEYYTKRLRSVIK